MNKEIKAPAWFVNGFKKADDLLEEPLQRVGVSTSWVGLPQKLDAAKLEGYLKQLNAQNKVSPDDLEFLLRRSKMRMFLSNFLWEKFRISYIGKELTDRLEYDPLRKVIIQCN